MMFTPPNYESHPDGSRTPDDNGKVSCHCGRKVHPFVLVDVKHLDNVEHDWACDACWTHWQRNRTPMMQADIVKPINTDKSQSRKDWDEKWLKGHGAPQSIINKMKQTNRRS